MQTIENLQAKTGSSANWWSILIPLVLLGLLVLAFTATNPLALFNANLPPVEALSIERVVVTKDGFVLSLFNSGPSPVTVAQVTVDDAYWKFTLEPAAPLERFGRARLTIPFKWFANDPYQIRVLSSTGLVFDAVVPVATLTPVPGIREFLAYGLLGVYVGIIPVGLGLVWYPAMRRMSRRWMGFILALTVGLLIFLIVDMLLEVFEAGAKLPGVVQGVPLALFAALLTWLAIVAVSNLRGRKPVAQTPAQGENKTRAAAGAGGLYLAVLIAFSIGLHNFGEGLSVGAAFAIGEVALGSFLVIGFILHNITEGIGIAAPLVTPKKGAAAEDPPLSRPSLGAFVGLAALAGGPAILGAWVGGFVTSPLISVVFLGVGIGAIFQVIVEVTRLLRNYAAAENASFASPLNLAGLLAGIAVMYFTAFLVK